MGATVDQRLDWDRRHGHMRIHTALHLLSVVIPLPVTGGAVGAGKGRLDFDMPEAPQDREVLEGQLNALVTRDLPVSEMWITETELDANPGLVKTLSVQPPRGAGRVRLVQIGAGAGAVDLQPCGGTHVARTGEIGKLRITKIEKKGATEPPRDDRNGLRPSEAVTRSGVNSRAISRVASAWSGPLSEISALARRSCAALSEARRRGGRVVEGARLERV